MTKRKPSPRIIPGGDFAYDLDRIEARRTGRYPDVPVAHRARSYGALKSPVDELVEDRNWTRFADGVLLRDSRTSWLLVEAKLRRP